MQFPTAFKNWERCLARINKINPDTRTVTTGTGPKHSGAQKVLRSGDVWQPMASAMREGEIVLWEPEIFDLALGNPRGLDGWVPQETDIPARPQWWAIDSRTNRWSAAWKAMEAHTLSELRRDKTHAGKLERLLGILVVGQVPADAASNKLVALANETLEIGSGKLYAYAFCGEEDVVGVQAYEVLVGEPLDAEKQSAFSNLIWGGIEFQKQRIAAKRREPSASRWQPKTERRAPLVTSVVLRRPEREGEPTPSKGGREFSCQWMVGAHWRQQACGKGRAERRPTFIAPYIKGPEDKELRMRPILLHAKK